MYETVSRRDKFRGSGRKDRAGASLIGLPEHAFLPEGYHVVVKPQDSWHRAHLCSTEGMVPLIESMAAAMATQGYPRKDSFGMRLALEEALLNSIRHGHQNDPNKRVEVRYRISREHVLVEVEDQGQGFDLSSLPDPTAPENLERTCGRGIFLMHAYTTWIRYNERGNCVTLCKCPSQPISAEQSTANRTEEPGNMQDRLLAHETPGAR